MRIRVTLIVAISAILLLTCNFNRITAEVFVMNDGTTYSGVITAETQDRIIVRLYSGGTITLERKDIARIEKDEIKETTWIWRQAVDDFVMGSQYPNEKSAKLFEAITRKLSGLDYLKVEQYCQRLWGNTLCDLVSKLYNKCPNDHGSHPFIKCPKCNGMGCQYCENSGSVICPRCLPLLKAHYSLIVKQNSLIPSLAILKIHLGDLPFEKFETLEKALWESPNVGYITSPFGKHEGQGLPGSRLFGLIIKRPAVISELAGIVRKWASLVPCNFDPVKEVVHTESEKTNLPYFETRFYISEPFTTSDVVCSFTKSGKVIGRKVDYNIGISCLRMGKEGMLQIYPSTEHLRGTVFPNMFTINMHNRDTVSEPLFISFEIEGVSKRTDKGISLLPNQKQSLQFNPEYIDELFGNNAAKETKIKVWIRPQFEITSGSLVLEETVNIESIYQCPFLPHEGLILAASYVTPEDKDKLVMGLVEELNKSKEDKFEGFIGYQREPIDVRRQIKVIYDGLKAQGFRYLNTPIVKFEKVEGFRWWDTLLSQRIRTPADVIRAKAGNCVELSLLFASIFEAIGIDSVIVDLPGHCMVGFVINERKNGMPTYKSDIVFIEATALESCTTIESIKIAEKKLWNWKYTKDDTVKVYLLRDLRNMGIKPCPLF